MKVKKQKKRGRQLTRAETGMLYGLIPGKSGGRCG